MNTRQRVCYIFYKLSFRIPLHWYSLKFIRCTDFFSGRNGSNIFLVPLLLLCTAASLSLAVPAGAVEAPSQIAGITLGSDVKSYPQFTQSNFMKEVVITDWHGFRKGIISYGVCKHLDTILKIDLKYEEKGKAFYGKLLEKFKQRFGEPEEWKGDSFGVILVWKWYFTDAEGSKISLVLQHNSKNSNETIGNIVKLSYPDKIAEEQRCFTEMCDATRKEAAGEGETVQNDTRSSDWSSLIPR